MGQNVGALRSQTLPAANLGCDESRFGGSEPARRSLLRLDASRTTADDIRLAGRLVLALCVRVRLRSFREKAPTVDDPGGTGAYH